MKDLRHENVVKIKGIIQDETANVVIIMEYIQEGSLDNYLKQNRDFIKINQLFIYGQNIVDGMSYLGTKGIIHRDLAAR